MFRSLLGRLGVTLKRSAAIINGDSSSTSAAKYFLFTAFQNQNVGISKSRFTNSIFYSFYTTVSNDSSNSFVVSYLINSCGLSENQAITASKKLNFKTTSQPDSVVSLLKAYGFTESHISKLISQYPAILSSNPDKTLKPKFHFFKSKGLHGLDLANFISADPLILRYSFNKAVIPNFEILKRIVQSDRNVITMMKRNNRILHGIQLKKLMANLELLRNEGVPENNIPKFFVRQPRAFSRNVEILKEIVEKVKQMGFNHLEDRFLRAIHVLAAMTEVSWRKKMDVYKRWGWSEDQILKAFRKDPLCMTTSEKKIMALMNFLVNEMGYGSSTVAEDPRILHCSLKERIIPRCSVIRVLLPRGLIRERISLNALATMVDESFREKFVQKYEQEVPGLMQVFQGQLNYQELLQN